VKWKVSSRRLLLLGGSLRCPTPRGAGPSLFLARMLAIASVALAKVTRASWLSCRLMSAGLLWLALVFRGQLRVFLLVELPSPLAKEWGSGD
jgi:hypothetical protein